MSQTVTLNGVSYTVPDPDDTGWGTYTTSYLTAIASNMLQKNGGSFALTNDADFGSTKGLIAAYFKSASSNIADAGVIRLSNTDDIAFRNAGNDGNLLLSADASTDGILTYNSVALATISATQTLTNKTLTSPVINTGISGTAIDNNTSLGSSATKVPTQNAVKSYVDAQLTASDLDFQGDTGGAQSVDLDSQTLTVEGGTGVDTTGSAQKVSIAIDSTVATLTGTQTLTNKTINSPKINEDVALTATSTYLNRMDATSSVQTQLNAKQATITGAATTIASSDLTASKALQSNGSGKVEVSSVTTTELGYVSGVTSALQTQLNAKQATIDSSNRLDADLIHDGTVSNTEFGYINSLTSNAQTQLDAKAPISQPEFTSYVDFDSISAPGAPSDSGDVRLYANSSKLYFQGQGDASPTEVGSGGGGAGDADTIQLKAANDFSAVNVAPWYTGNNPVPGGGGSIGGTWEISTSNPLINIDGKTNVFHYSNGTSNRKNDYFEIELDVPNYAKGHNLVLQLFYRTVGAEDTDFLFFARDRTADYETTTSSSGALNTITLASATGFAIGDRICIQDSSDTRHFRYVTAVSGSDITFSGSAITVGSGDVVISKYFTDELDTIAAENNTTNYEGKIRKWAFQINETTTKIRVGFIYNNTATSTNELFFDQILLSSNQFLQTSSKPRSGTYWIGQFTDEMDNIADTMEWDLSDATIRKHGNEETLTKCLEVSNVSSVTRFTALQDCVFEAQGSVACGSTGYDSATIWHNKPDGTQYLMAYGSYSSANSHITRVSGSIAMKKGEYLFMALKGSNPSSWTPPSRTAYSGDSPCIFSVTVTPQVSDCILLSSEDEIFSDWQSFTPSWSSGGFGTLHEARWRRDGCEMEVFVSGITGTTTPAIAYTELPSGYNVDISKFSSTTSTYHPVGEFGIPTINTDDTLYMAVRSDDYPNRIYFAVSSAAGYAYDTARNWNWFFSSTTKFFLRYRVPIQGWTSTFNPVLSMPLVDFGSYENTFAAVVQSDTTIRSQGGGWLASVTNPSTGEYNLTFTSGFFTQPPSVVVTPLDNGGNQGSAYYATTTSGTEAWFTVSNSGVNQNYEFGITVTRQGSDWREPPQATAAVIKPSVCLLKDVKAYNGQSGTNGTGNNTWHTRDLNTIEGESWFLSLASNQFTLEPGMYEIYFVSPYYRVDAYASRLYDVTNSEVVVDGSCGHNDSSVATQGESVGFAVITVTSSTAYRVEYSTNGSSNANYGLGYYNYYNSSSKSVYTQVSVRKLK